MQCTVVTARHAHTHPAGGTAAAAMQHWRHAACAAGSGCRAVAAAAPGTLGSRLGAHSSRLGAQSHLGGNLEGGTQRALHHVQVHKGGGHHNLNGAGHAACRGRPETGGAAALSKGAGHLAGHLECLVAHGSGCTQRAQHRWGVPWAATCDKWPPTAARLQLTATGCCGQQRCTRHRHSRSRASI